MDTVMNLYETKTKGATVYRVLLVLLMLLLMLLLCAILVEIKYIDLATLLPERTFPAAEPVPATESLEPEPTPAPTPRPTPTPTPPPTPTPDPEELAHEELLKRQANETELLTLVNRWNPLEEGYEPELAELNWQDEDFRVDRRCADALMDMLTDCVKAGHNPWVCSAYRDLDYQADLLDNKILRVIAEGTRPSLAYEEAAMSVAIPGTSEHHLGLAVDLVDFITPDLTVEQEKTETQQWLMEHCYDYGFILRYPNGTSEITGIIYEPWHYRYVGKVAAAEIRERGITLEEYLYILYR